MANRWCLRVQQSDLAAIRSFRLTPQVTVLEEYTTIWLQGSDLNDELQLRVRSIPEAELFHLQPDDQLRRPGERVPCGYLPSGTWTEISQWLQPELPVAILAGRISERVTLRLIRSDRVVESSVLITDIKTWDAYAGSAPRVRLDRWMFAVSENSRVVIRGLPLPPIPGQHFVENEGIATPAGFEWMPAIDARGVRSLLNISDTDLVLMSEDGSYELVRSQDFVRATRSAVRLSARIDDA